MTIKALMLGILMPCAIFTASAQTAKVVGLECDHLVSPIGIDNPNPRLAWKMDDASQGAGWKSWRVEVDTDSLLLARGSKARLWDSDFVYGGDHITQYAGEVLQPFTKYFWRVSLVDNEGNTRVSEISSFETGMMDISSWNGAWIGDGKDIDYRPAPYFRRTFQADGARKLKSARAYIVAAGLYELYLNGNKVGDHFLDPMYSRFDRRNYYVTYDVTSQIAEGQNAIGVILGNGWYNHQSGAVWDFDKAPWRRRPAFCFDLRLEYEDGSVETVSSDLAWKTSSGPLVSNSIYTGEQYDARLAESGWAKSDFDDSAWHGVGFRGAPSDNIAAQQMQPIRMTDEYKVVKMTKFSDTDYLFDFGQNMAGITKVRLSGEEGTVVRLKHGERLYKPGHEKAGHLDISNVDIYHRPVDDTDPFATDIIILDGKSETEFAPKFNYKGFRYVEVTSDRPISLTENSIKAYFVHSDVAPAGHLHSSNDVIDRIWQASRMSYLSNLMGYPTDCPQREKNGWTGDGHFAIEAALYNYDGITVYEKWLADHGDEQQPNGVLPDIIPTGGWGYGTDNGVDWTSTIAIIPWNLYKFYGDSKCLEDCYYNIKRYVDYIDRTYPSGLTNWGRGDWVPVKAQAEKELMSSIYYYVDTDILAKAAKLFGHDADAEHYAALAEKIKNAINAKYLDADAGVYASGVQTELSMPLYWGIVPEELKAKVAENLALVVEKAGFHLDVGVHGSKALLNALCENGQEETAYKVAVQTTYPSWGNWVVNGGATTLLEEWNLDAEFNISDNHMMFGEIGCWFYKGLGGIYPDENEPGFRHIVLKPYFPAGLGDFECSHISPFGEIVSSWTRQRSKVVCNVTVPAGSHATFHVPSAFRLVKHGSGADAGKNAVSFGKSENVRELELESGRHILTLVAGPILR